MFAKGDQRPRSLLLRLRCAPGRASCRARVREDALTHSRVRVHGGGETGRGHCCAPQETDEQLARRLQGEEDAGRPRRRAAVTAQKRSKQAEFKPFKRSKGGDGHGPDAGADGSVSESQPKRAGAGITAEMVLSPVLAEFLGQPEMSRPQVVKRLWEYIKANNLQDPNDKRTIVCDDRLRRVFNRDAVSMFKMNQLLSVHVKGRNEIVS